MTFIGIAIFTVYTAQTVFIGGCAYRPPSAGSICADMYRSQLQETGHSESRYAGEFPSIEACQKAVGAMKYVPEKGERVDEIIEVLCVPKSSASNPGADAPDTEVKP